MQNIANFPTDQRGQPLVPDLHRDYYVNNFLFSNVFHAFISINNTLHYLVLENGTLAISKERVPYQGLKFGFFTFADAKFDAKGGLGYLDKANTLTEEGIVRYEYSPEHGFEKDLVSRNYYTNRIRYSSANMKVNFMHLVALLSYTDKQRDANLAFFSREVTFVFRLPIPNLKILTSTKQEDAVINLDDAKHTSLHDYNFLNCFYQFQTNKFSGRSPVPEPEDDILNHRINYLAYGVAAATAAFILLLFCVCGYLFRGESSRERRERLKKKLFSNKFMKFLRKKERSQKFESSRSARLRASANRSELANRYKTVKKIVVASPSGSTKTEEGSRAAGGPRTDRTVGYKSTPELKTIDSIGGAPTSEKRSPKTSMEVLPENLLRFKSGSFKSQTLRVSETKNKITSLMDKVKEMKKSLQ